jgi:WD40 repeat protein
VVNAVAFSPDGKVLAAASNDNTALGWNVPAGTLIFRLPHPAPVTSLAWDGAHDLITGAADGTGRLWVVPPPVLHADGPVYSASFSPGGRTLAVGGTDLSLWDMATDTRVIAAAVPGTFVDAVAFSPEGGVLAAGYGDGDVQLWHAAGQGALRPAGPPWRASASGTVEFVTFRRDGAVLATAGGDGTVRLWRVTDPARPVPLAVINDAARCVFSAVFSPDGRVLAAASADRTVRLWNVSDLTRPVSLTSPLGGARGSVYSVAFSPDGRTLAAGGADRTVRLWSLANPARPTSFGGALTGPGGDVYSLAFSPDGRTLAAGVTDGTVWLWRTSGGSLPVERADLSGPARQVYSVAFGPLGRVIAAASADGTVRLWRTAPSAAAAAVCAMAGDPLTRAEWRRYVPGVPYATPCRDGRPAG